MIWQLARASANLRQDDSGVTAIEFAMMAPVFLSMLIGMLDLGQMGYGMAVLNGAVQKAGRASALETASLNDADAYVKALILPIFPEATVTSTRKSYYDFTDIGRQEPLTDTNSNGKCDTGEAYVDENDNNTWDKDVGRSGNGGGNDVVLYTVKVEYTSLFKVPLMPASWGNRTITVSSVKKNQPYGTQTAYSSTSKVC